jgi:N-methylhydantoinase B
LTNGAGADKALASGRIPASVEELDGQAQSLQGKQFGMIVLPGDVMTLNSGGGGGYSDPIERDPAQVAEDVRAGRVTEPAARESYGVVVVEGQADAAATAARRAEIRAERRGWPREGEFTVRRGPAAARMAELHQWCAPRDGVELAEYADPATGTLVRTQLLVAEDA